MYDDNNIYMIDSNYISSISSYSYITIICNNYIDIDMLYDMIIYSIMLYMLIVVYIICLYAYRYSMLWVYIVSCLYVHSIRFILYQKRFICII